MSVDSAPYRQFYNHLLGDETRQEALTAQLATNLANPDLEFHTAAPFLILQGNLNGVITQAARGITGIDPSAKGVIADNGAFGSERIVATLRTVADIYASHAAVPQRVDGVHKNTQRALSYLFGMAFAGRLVATHNLECYYFGLNPRNPLTIPASILGELFDTALYMRDEATNRPTQQRRHISKHSFVTTTDQAGQLDIRPRFKRVKRKGPKQCPSTYNQVEVGGSKKSGLHTLMRTVGEVAVDKIFPTYFLITDELMG